LRDCVAALRRNDAPYFDSHFDSRTEPVDDGHQAIDREPPEVAVADAGEVGGCGSRAPLRSAHSQALPIERLDDRRDAGVPGLISDPFQVARLGIDLVVEGGFDKVAWDGASSEIPSKPIIGQLSHEQLLRLVHEAHERGLETYISAGMVSKHMRDATYIGVGGVGIGTQLHYMDPVSKLLGELKPAEVRQALEIRDQAASELRGRAAGWLAWLDRLYFEGVLLEDLEPVRRKLVEAAAKIDEPALEAYIQDLEKRASQQAGAVLPSCSRSAVDITGQGSACLDRAHRFLRVSGIRTVASSGQKDDSWSRHVENVRGLAERGDATALQHYFSR